MPGDSNDKPLSIEDNLTAIARSGMFKGKDKELELLRLLVDGHYDGKETTPKAFYREILNALYASNGKAATNGNGHPNGNGHTNDNGHTTGRAAKSPKEALRTLKKQLKDHLKRFYADEGAEFEFVIAIPDRRWAVEITRQGAPQSAQSKQEDGVDSISDRGEHDDPVRPSQRSVLLRGQAKWLAGFGASAALAAAFWLTSISIVTPANGSTVSVGPYGRSIIAVQGHGGHPWLYRYLVVEPGGDIPGAARYVQQCREFPAGWFQAWKCDPVYIGDDFTAAGTDFRIYVMESSKPLMPGTDFDLDSGVLSETYPRNRPEHTIDVKLSR